MCNYNVCYSEFVLLQHNINLWNVQNVKNNEYSKSDFAKEEQRNSCFFTRLCKQN